MYKHICIWKCVLDNSFNYCQKFDYKFNTQLTLIKQKWKWICADRRFKFSFLLEDKLFAEFNFKLARKKKGEGKWKIGEGLVFLFIFPVLNVETYSCKWKNAGGKTFLLTHTKTKRATREGVCVCVWGGSVFCCVCAWGCACIGTCIYMIFRKHSLQS